MRRLLVPLVLVGSILLVQSPAHAYHRFYLISPLRSKGEDVRITVDTNCEEGKRFTIRSAALGFSASRRVPRARFGPRKDIARLTFAAQVAGKSSTAKATFTATCNSHPLCPVKKERCPEDLKSKGALLLLPQELVDPADPSELPSTGVSTPRWLVLGLCLLLAGGLLLAFARRKEV